MTPRERYAAAAHAVQTGVRFDIDTDADQASQGASTPKHLRTGLNHAACEHSALAGLLIARGIITEAEYLEAVASGLEREKARCEDILAERLGKPVRLV